MTVIFNHTQRWDDYRTGYPGLDILTDADYHKAVRILRGPRPADLVIAPDGKPYLYRWHLYPKDELGFNQYFHIQVASDPARPLHDHPWNNWSRILSGGYEETIQALPATEAFVEIRKPGDDIYRRADMAHRLELPVGVKYTMTLFDTGPKIREWGFWYPDGWVHHSEVTHTTGNVTVNIGRGDARSAV